MTAQNVGEGDIKNVRAVLCANDIHSRGKHDGYGYRFDGIPGPQGHPNATQGAERETRLRISDRRRRKAKSQNFVQKEGAHDGTRTHVGMNEQEIGPAGVVIKEQEGTSHQAALVIGGIKIL
jgi:hypothetical protein